LSAFAQAGSEQTRDPETRSAVVWYRRLHTSQRSVTTYVRFAAWAARCASRWWLFITSPSIERCRVPPLEEKSTAASWSRGAATIRR
jgi:hypothetical protein